MKKYYVVREISGTPKSARHEMLLGARMALFDLAKANPCKQYGLFELLSVAEGRPPEVQVILTTPQ